MAFGTNLLPIINIVQNNEITQVIKFIRTRYLEYPQQCVGLHVLNKNLLVAYNNHLAYLIDQNTRHVAKLPCSGEMIHIEISKDGGKYTLYYVIDDNIIVSDEIYSYDWDRSMQQEHGVRVNRRYFTYNYRQNIAAIDGSPNYMVITTTDGEIFIIDKKDIVNTMDNSTCRSVAQAVTINDYRAAADLIDTELNSEIKKYASEGTMLNATIRESADGRFINLYVMLLVSSTPYKFKLFEHTIDTKTLTMIAPHEYYANYEIHGCKLCNADYSLDCLVDVIAYFKKMNKENIKVIHCNKGSGSNVYVTYAELENENAGKQTWHTMALRYNSKNKLEKWLDLDINDKELFNSKFILRHSVKLADKTLLLHIDDNNCETCVKDATDEDIYKAQVKYMCVEVDLNGNIIKSYEGTIPKTEATTLSMISDLEGYSAEGANMSPEEEEELKDEFESALKDMEATAEQVQTSLELQEAEEAAQEEAEEAEQEDNMEESEEEAEESEETEENAESNYDANQQMSEQYDYDKDLKYDNSEVIM